MPIGSNKILVNIFPQNIFLKEMLFFRQYLPGIAVLRIFRLYRDSEFGPFTN